MANKLYLKDEFEKWMAQQSKSNGSPYSTNTINSYITFIKNGTAKLKNHNIEYTDLFNYSDLNTLKQAYKKITQEPDFDEVDLACANRAFSYGVRLYMNFLEKAGNIKPEDVSLDLSKLNEYIEYLKIKPSFLVT